VRATGFGPGFTLAVTAPALIAGASSTRSAEISGAWASGTGAEVGTISPFVASLAEVGLTDGVFTREMGWVVADVLGRRP
jgi:hypothetical protein